MHGLAMVFDIYGYTQGIFGMRGIALGLVVHTGIIIGFASYAFLPSLREVELVLQTE